MLKVGDLVVSRNGEFGWIERFTHPGYQLAWVRGLDGFVQTFGAHGLRHPDPDKDWEVFAHVAEAETQLKWAAE